MKNRIKLAGLAFYADYGKEFFDNENQAIDFIEWNLKKGYMSDSFIETCAKMQESGKPFKMGDMPKFYGEWRDENIQN